MITRFKIFEDVNIDKPEIGDYVICIEYNDDYKLLKFLSKNIGQYVEKTGDEEFPCDIQYTDVPKYLMLPYFSDGCRYYAMDEILYWSKNKNELKKFLPVDFTMALAAKKYNL